MLQWALQTYSFCFSFSRFIEPTQTEGVHLWCRARTLYQCIQSLCFSGSDAASSTDDKENPFLLHRRFDGMYHLAANIKEPELPQEVESSFPPCRQPHSWILCLVQVNPSIISTSSAYSSYIIHYRIHSYEPVPCALRHVLHWNTLPSVSEDDWAPSGFLICTGLMECVIIHWPAEHFCHWRPAMQVWIVVVL